MADFAAAMRKGLEANKRREESRPKFGLWFRVRTVGTQGKPGVGFREAPFEWGTCGVIVGAHDPVATKKSPTWRHGNIPVKQMYQVDHSEALGSDEKLTGWYAEEELELEIAGRDKHAGLLASLVLRWDPVDAKVFADVCAERGLHAVADLLAVGEPSEAIRMSITALACMSGIRKSLSFLSVTGCWSGSPNGYPDWRAGWCDWED